MTLARKEGKRGLPSPLLSLVLALLAVAHSQASPCLVVTGEAGETILALDLSLEPDWIFLWRHSVAGFVVSDHYSYREGRMILTQSHTPDFAAGLGYLRGRGRLESDDAQGYWIRDIDEAVPGDRYALRVGARELEPRIRHAGVTYPLDRAANTRVWVSVGSCHGL